MKKETFEPEKIDPTLKPLEEEVAPVTPMFRGDQVYKAPQDAITDADATAFTSSGGAGTHVDDSAIAILNNMRSRINALETALVRLGFLKP